MHCAAQASYWYNQGFHFWLGGRLPPLFIFESRSERRIPSSDFYYTIGGQSTSKVTFWLASDLAGACGPTPLLSSSPHSSANHRHNRRSSISSRALRAGGTLRYSAIEEEPCLSPSEAIVGPHHREWSDLRGPWERLSGGSPWSASASARTPSEASIGLRDPLGGTEESYCFHSRHFPSQVMM